MSKRILFTGGGSAGHVTVNVALIPRFVASGWDVSYIGSIKGIESELIRNVDHVDYHGISTGKLRRYMSVENFKDPFRIVKGVFEAYSLIRKIKPDVVFSKGGFVSVPVVIGAKLNNVPIIIHESDITPGLANKIALPLATKVCVTFPETLDHIKSDKATYVGAIIRDELRAGNAARGRSLLKFVSSKPIILVMGGSLGSKKINGTIRNNLSQLLKQYQVVHICGKDQIDPSIHLDGYQQFEYIHDELSDVIASADVVVTRAGSNSIFEFLALHKPMLLIPLSRAASRGDQILNAQSFQKAGYAEVLMEEELSDDSFIKSLELLLSNRVQIVDNMTKHDHSSTIDQVIGLIQKAAKKK
ncbi:UDP-N-acetylglucosamine--N-acetylmuramyl-(pentapeptide) pyrophosphoryl-undecaprenol N-acetylglucosamine transferase [Paenibacillus macquariensis subsp. defensor]|nr:UDP-N-acetylglucosamine--N-acetylmuramyl-(pentapeptide) pyrophosphoryl-undecaprenol N-acetylglucosamine transferase [Paenibacillus macquariensis subsp. defensor]